MNAVYFIGRRHLAVIRFCAGGGGSGTLAGVDLDGLRQPGEHLHGLVPPTVSVVFLYGTVLYYCTLISHK